MEAIQGIKLSALDFGVLILFVCMITGLAFYFTRMLRTTKDYFLGGRNLPWYAVMISIVAGETSAATVIAVPAWSYAPEGGDLTFMQLTFGYLLARIILGYNFVPRLYRGAPLSIYTYLEKRFGPAAKNIAGLTYFVTRALATGVRIYIPAIVVHQIVPSIPIGACIVFSTVIALFYTGFGGFRAVVWMDVIMFTIYIGGGIIAMIIILQKLTPLEIGNIALAAEKLKVFVWDVDIKLNYTFLSGFVGGCFLSMATHGTDQSIGQRLLSCRTEKDSRLAIIGSGCIIVPQFLFFLFLGIMLYAFFMPNLPQLGKAAEIFPYFIINYMPAGLVGIVLAGIFAAAMSTTSADLNALANIAVNDFYRPYVKKEASDKHYLVVSRITTAFWAGVLILIAFIPAVAPPEYRLLDIVLAIPALTYGALLGAFLLGFITVRGNQRGVIIGAICGAIAAITVSLIPLLQRLFPETFPAFFGKIHVGWPWYTPIGCLTTMFVGYVVSIAYPEKKETSA
jgi:SSS family transporter